MKPLMVIQNRDYIDKPSALVRILPPFMIASFCLLMLHFTNFLVFHVLAELFSICIGLTALTVAVTSARFTQNQFIIFLSLSAGWCACLDIVHILVYKGMNILTHNGGNESTQLWIAARFLQAFCVLIAPWFFNHRVKIWMINLVLASIVFAVSLLIVQSRFPTTYIDGYGLTSFKIMAEWVIIAILLLSLGILWLYRALMPPVLLIYLNLFIVGMILSEFLLSQYTNLYGWQNISGHVLKIFYYWYIYMALVAQTLTRPFNMLARTANSYNQIPDPVVVIQHDGIISQANDAAGVFATLDPAHLIGLSGHKVFHNQLVNADDCPVCSQLKQKSEPFTVELHIDGQWLECALSPVNSPFFPNSWVEVIRDISSRKIIEQERSKTLENLNERIKELSCLNTLSALVATQEATIEELLTQTARLLPQAFQFPEKMAASIDSDWGAFYSAVKAKPVTQALSQDLIIENRHRGRISVYYHEEPPPNTSLYLPEEEKLMAAVSSLISSAINHILASEKADIAEYRFKESEQHFKAILDQTAVGVYVRSNEKFLYVNPRFCEIVGRDEASLLSLGLMDLIADEATQKVVRAHWDELKQQHSGISYNLSMTKPDGTAILLRIDATMMNWNGALQTIALVQDVTEVERAREQIDTYVTELEHAIKGIFTAVSTMIELRDPYTAGHQHRVGLIAKAIGAELGWSKERCKYLELIGLVHDIGKISIPAEILSKPTRLTPFEMEIIKKHPESGYDILKHIHFKFPVAEVILQHHERLDGTGYPRGLKGDDILPETRIITVADVFEAMSAHRPYRPALGTEAALNELRRGRGTIYDADVVDAAIKVIERGQFG